MQCKGGKVQIGLRPVQKVETVLSKADGGRRIAVRKHGEAGCTAPTLRSTFYSIEGFALG